MQCCGSMCFRLWCVYWVPCSVGMRTTEDGPSGPKHVGVNIKYFNVNFNILYVQ
jgi:hypothetical protein